MANKKTTNKIAQFKLEFSMKNIFIIGFIGLGTDLILAWLGRRMFRWDKPANKE